MEERGLKLLAVTRRQARQLLGMSGHGSRAGPADYTTLAVIDGDARGMRSSDYAAVVRAADGFRIAGLVSQPGGVYVAPGVHAIAVRNASGSR